MSASRTAADDAAGFTGSIPEHYDQGLGPILFADFAEDMARRATAGAPSRVLETAAGTGIVTRRLRDLMPQGARLVATDLNPPMLDVARRKLRSGEQVDFQSADALALPFADGAFDAVVCQFGVMFFPDKDRSFREAHRVLALGGRYLFSVWDSAQYNAFARITQDAAGRLFPDDPPQFYRVPVGYHAMDPIKEALLAAGFAGLSATVLRREKTVPDLATFARALVLGNPLIEEIRRRGGVGPEAAIAAIAAALRAEFGPDPARMTLQMILFEAHRDGAAGGA